MNGKLIFTLAKKDWMEVRQNPSAWMPMLVIPLIFMVIFPLGMILAFTFIPNASNVMMDPQMEAFFKQMPPAMLQPVAGLNPTQTMLVLMLGYFFAPFFLIIPLMFSTVIASESFAGEYERKTIESLLYTAATDAELFLGKVVAALIPSISITFISFLLYTLVVNIAGFSLMGRIWFPLVNWWPLIFWVAPALALAGVSATVLISARVRTFMGTYQASASTVVLVLALLVGQVTGVLYLSVLVGLALGALIWILGAVLTVYAVRTFNRQSLLSGTK
jgi:ABC-2 type transport system permease protein